MDSTYKVKEEDLIGELTGFPREVVQWMVDEQGRQGRSVDISGFSRE